MTTHESTPQSAKEMFDALTTFRDRARVQAHLFSLDARRRWQGLETKLVELESKLEQSGERIAATTAASFKEVSQAARELMRELDGTLELTAPVRELMKEAPSTCLPGDSLNQAAQIMWELDCGAVPVVDAEGRVAGVLTDRDISMAAYTRGQVLAAMSVESAMSKDVCSCSPDDSIGHAAQLMAEKQIRRLPVLEHGKLVGLLTLADVARDINKQKGNRIPACVALAHTLASISEHRATGGGQAHAAE